MEAMVARTATVFEPVFEIGAKQDEQQTFQIGTFRKIKDHIQNYVSEVLIQSYCDLCNSIDKLQIVRYDDVLATVEVVEMPLTGSESENQLKHVKYHDKCSTTDAVSTLHLLERVYFAETVSVEKIEYSKNIHHTMLVLPIHHGRYCIGVTSLSISPDLAEAVVLAVLAALKDNSWDGAVIGRIEDFVGRSRV